MTTFTPELTEFISQSDTVLNGWPDVSEVVPIVEVYTATGTYNHVNVESPVALDDLLAGWDFTISETVTISETYLLEVGILLEEIINLVGEVGIVGTYNPVLTDIISTIGSLLGNSEFIDTLTESPAFTDTVAEEFFLVQNLFETISISDPSTVIGDVSVTLLESLTVVDALLRAFVEAVADSATGADSIIVLLTLKNLVTSVATMSGVVDDGHLMNHLVTETPVITETVSNIGTFIVTISDSGEASTTIALDGEVYQCWVMTTDDFKISSYTNFNFNSFGVVDGFLFGAKDDGVYLIQNSDVDDAGTPINSGIQFNFETLMDLHAKRFRKAYIGSTGTNTVLKVEDDDSNARYYALDRKQVTIGKDLQSRRFKFSLRAIDSIDHIDFYPLLLDKNR